MQKFSTIKYCSLVFCIFLVFAEMSSSVPFYSDYEREGKFLKGIRVQCLSRQCEVIYHPTLILEEDEEKESPAIMASKLSMIKEAQKQKRKSTGKDIRDLYELLLKKEALDDQLSQPHQLVRKSNRSPSLRLRFGKKRDPYFASSQFMGHPVHVLDDVDN